MTLHVPKSLKIKRIDLVITNEPKYFLKSITIETGLSDFHKMTTTVHKFYVKK